MTLTPLPLIHSKPTFGYAIEDSEGHQFAYLTDTAGLPTKTEKFLVNQEIDDLAIDYTYPSGAAARNHNDLTQALLIIDRIKLKRAHLTHIGHAVDEWLLNNEAALPPIVSVARDDLVVQVSD